MKVKNLFYISILLLMAGLLSACSGQAATTWAGMTADNSLVYLANGSHVYAVKLSDGTEISSVVGGESKPMRYPESGDSNKVFYAEPTLTEDGQFIVGSAGRSHGLYSVSTQNFSENWSFTKAKDAWVGSVLVMNERVYAPSGDGNLYTFDLKGNLLWTFSQPKKGLWSRPATDGQNLYLTSLDHFVYALDARNGNLIWNVELDGAILETPALSADGILYVGTLNKTVYALDASNGSKLWQKSVDGWVWAGPVLDAEGSRLYFGVAVNSNGGRLYALEPSNGNELWKINTDGAITGKPLLHAERIIVGTETGSIYAFDFDGNQLWRKAIEGKIYSSPIAAGDLILVAPMQGKYLLLALDVIGNEKWVFAPK